LKKQNLFKESSVKQNTPRYPGHRVRQSSLATSALALALFCATTFTGAPAQTFTKLADFDGTNGSSPRGALVQGTDGNLYGAAVSGGSTQPCQGVSGCGTIFRVTTGGAITPLHVFETTDGSHPPAAPLEAADGNFYGTTNEGGLHSRGTVFKMASDGTLNTLYNFQFTAGQHPAGGLVWATTGNFYGTTSFGGAHQNGAIFTSTPQGSLRTTYSFCGQTGCPDGQAANDGLIQATDGNFYGTTPAGGANKFGTVFKMTPAGTLTTLYTFCSKTNCADGATPNVTLVQGTDGNIYGTTEQGGAHSAGTVFKVSPKGVFVTLHSFCETLACKDGSNPQGGLVLATDGSLYGTTTASGASSRGTIFQITERGLLTPLYTFQATDGQFPGQLTQDTDGNFYGTMQVGGLNGVGTFFRLSTGLAPFVKTLQTAAKVGSSVIILGSDLTGATSVTFHGTPASFSFVSATEITAAVPTGATTGKIQVVTPAGPLSSNVPFHVIP
jgi:uncharacterized repeat protein (TIGR03803 family)